MQSNPSVDVGDTAQNEAFEVKNSLMAAFNKGIDSTDIKVCLLRIILFLLSPSKLECFHQSKWGRKTWNPSLKFSGFEVENCMGSMN